MQSEHEKPLKGKKGKADGLRARFANPAYVEQTAKPGPQAVVRVMSQARGFQAQRVMDYIARTENAQEKHEDMDLPFEDANGIKREGAAAIEAKYQEWAEKFERAKPGQKRPPRHVTHMMLSASCENTDSNARKVLSATRDVLQEQLGAKGYDYILVMHRDTKTPHVHVVINNYNMDADKRKLRLNPPELFELRLSFSEKLQALGIEQAATLKRDRPAVLEQVRKGMARLKERKTWVQATMARAAPTMDALAERERIAKTVTKLRDQVKEATGPLTTERKEYMGALRELSAALIQPGADLSKQVEATIRKLEKEHAQVRAFAQDLRPSRDKDAPPLNYRQRLQRQRAVEKLSEQALQKIDAAIKTVRASGLTAEKKAQTVKQLNNLQRGFGKGMNLGI